MPQPGAKLVPMPPEEFARRRRQEFLKWGSAGAIVALMILGFLYRSSIPANALNDYIDAKKFYDSGKYTDALGAVNKAIRDRGERVRAYKLRAEIFRAMHQPKEAVEDITRVIEMQPDVAEHYAFRADTYLELDDPASAVKDYTKLIDLNHSGEAYKGRGLCFVKMNASQRAIDDFTKAIEQDPKVEFYLQRGLAWGTLGDHRKAIADFDRASEMRSDLSAIYRARAAEKLAIGDGAGAERDREKATSLEKPVPPKPLQAVLPKRG